MFKRILRSALCIAMAFVIYIIGIPAAKAIEPANDTIYAGIDVSKWQGTINYAQVKQAGIEIVYIRAGQGSDYVDPYFDRNYNEAKAAGLKVGFYHFVTAQSVTEAEQEARFFVSIIGNRQPDCLLVGDFEYFSGMTKTQFNQAARTFLETVEEMTGKSAAVYTSTSGARDRFTSEVSSRFPLWVAEYGVSEPRDNGNWAVWVGWQYSNTGRVSGIRGNVDLDHFTASILLENTAPISPQPNPPREITYYRVVRGDTLTKIARRFDTTVQELADLNRISDPNRIYVGDILKISTTHSPEVSPDTQEYTVRRGDTLSQLARRFDTTVQSIVNMNGIPQPDLIYTGEILRIRPGNSSEFPNAYTVRRGDTLGAIAQRFHTTVVKLTRLNRIQNPNLIFPGQILELAASK